MSKKWSYLAFAAVMAVLGFAFSCGSDKDDDKDSGTGTKYSWIADVSPIVESDCTQSGCHGTTNTKSVVFQNNEANFKASKTQVIARLSLSPETPGFMPRGLTTSYDVDKKQKLIDFLNQ